MRSKVLAIVLIVLGVGATLGGVYGQVFLAEDDGHHDDRTPTFALESQIGIDELVVDVVGDGAVVADVRRSGQQLGLDDLHDGVAHYFVGRRALVDLRSHGGRHVRPDAARCSSRPDPCDCSGRPIERHRLPRTRRHRGRARDDRRGPAGDRCRPSGPMVRSPSTARDSTSCSQKPGTVTTCTKGPPS